MSKGTRLEGNTIGFEQKPKRSLRDKLGLPLVMFCLSSIGAPSDMQQSSNSEKTECNKLEGSVVPGDHSMDLVDTRPMPEYPIPGIVGPFTDTGNYISDQLGMDPQLGLEEFAKIYLARLVAIKGSEIDIILDPSLGLSDWPGNISDLSSAMDTAKVLSSVISQIMIYNPDILQRFGIDRIRLANIYQTFAGHYNPGDHEILFDFKDDKLQDEGIYKVMIHELAHAYYDKFCNGIQHNDSEISNHNSIEYVGCPGECGDNNIPQELYQYGLRREFVNEYATSSVKEDFATIVAWSFVERGIIMPGDADYKSPLYYKQQIIIDRLEQMIPGSREFLAKLTILLRLKNDNEIYLDQDLPKVEVEVPKLLDLIKGQRQGIMGESPEDPIVLDALQASWSYPYLFYPDIFFNVVPEVVPEVHPMDVGPTKDEIIVIDVGQYTDDYYRYHTGSESPDGEQYFTVYVPKEDIVGGRYKGDLFVPASQSRASTKQKFNIEDFMKGGGSYDLLKRGWTPIIIKLVS